MTTCPRHGSYASRLRSVLMKMRMIMTKSMSKNMRTNMSMSMRIHFRFLCASSSPHHGRGEGIQQQPGARLTMACFTLPPWHMTASNIFATGQCQREPTTSNFSWCKQEAALLNDPRVLQHRDSRCHTKSRDVSCRLFSADRPAGDLARARIVSLASPHTLWCSGSSRRRASRNSPRDLLEDRPR